jgi:predicted metalloprotease with PDZ domain
MRGIKHLLALALVGLLVPAATLAQNRRPAPVKPGWLGIRCNIKVVSTNGRATITISVGEVVPGSPAEHSGLKTGDRIISVDGRNMGRDCGEMGRDIEAGDTITLHLQSGDREREVTLVAAERPAEYYTLTRVPSDEMIWLSGDSLRRMVRIMTDSFRIRIDSLYGDSVMFREFPRIAYGRRIQADSLRRIFPFNDTILFNRGMRFEFPRPDEVPLITRFEMLGHRGVAGAELTELNPGLAQYFGTREGLLVTNVGPDTPADRAGLEAGDVLIRIDGRAVSEVEDFRMAVLRRGGQPLKLEIIRKQKPVTLEFDPRSPRD